MCAIGDSLLVEAEGRDTSETIIGMRMMLVELEGGRDTRDNLSKFKVSCTAVLPRLPVMALTTKLWKVIVSGWCACKWTPTARGTSEHSQLEEVVGGGRNG